MTCPLAHNFIIEASQEANRLFFKPHFSIHLIFPLKANQMTCQPAVPHRQAALASLWKQRWLQNMLKTVQLPHEFLISIVKGPYLFKGRLLSSLMGGSWCIMCLETLTGHRKNQA